jgi:hypothetical protein
VLIGIGAVIGEGALLETGSQVRGAQDSTCHSIPRGSRALNRSEEGC